MEMIKPGRWRYRGAVATGERSRCRPVPRAAGGYSSTVPMEVLVVAAVFLVLALGKAYLPVASRVAQDWERIECPFAVLVGVPCPLCGLTRSGALLLRGDLVGAIRAHPLGPAALLVALLLVGHALVVARQGRPVLPNRGRRQGVYYLAAGAFLAVWLARVLGAGRGG